MERRAGDSVAVWAATNLAETELGWKSKYNIDDMCRWVNGYGYSSNSTHTPMQERAHASSPTFCLPTHGGWHWGGCRMSVGPG